MRSDTDSSTNWWLVYNPLLRTRDDVQAIMVRKSHATAHQAWRDSSLPDLPAFAECRVEPWTTERFETLDKIAEAAEVPAMTLQQVHEFLGGEQGEPSVDQPTEVEPTPSPA